MLHGSRFSKLVHQLHQKQFKQDHVILIILYAFKVHKSNSACQTFIPQGFTFHISDTSLAFDCQNSISIISEIHLPPFFMQHGQKNLQSAEKKWKAQFEPEGGQFKPSMDDSMEHGEVPGHRP